MANAMKSRLFGFLGASALTLGCMAAATVATPPALTLLTLANARYRSADWGEFQLTDGAYLRPTPPPGGSPDAYKTVFLGPVAHGDLNDDGVEDAAVFLSTQNGGTGHFIELAAVLSRQGSPENVSTVSIGDRIGVEAARIEAGIIILDLRVHGPNDPMCCASQLETWRFELANGQLTRLP